MHNNATQDTEMDRKVAFSITLLPTFDVSSFRTGGQRRRCPLTKPKRSNKARFETNLYITFVASLNDEQEDSRTKIRKFTEWFTENVKKEAHGRSGEEVVVDLPVTLEEIPGMGVGARAKRLIEQGERILWVPESMIFTTDAILRNSGLGEYIKSCKEYDQGLFTDYMILTLFILYERKYRSWVQCQPYIDILPETVPVTPLWSKENLNLLMGSEAWRLATNQFQDMRKEYTLLTDALFSKHPSVFPIFTTFSWDEFAKAYSVVCSRCWRPSKKAGRVVLVPFADSFNHSHSSDTILEIEAQDAELKAASSYAPGEQVFLCYGRRSNAYMLCDYGFALDPNPAETVAVDLTMKLEGDPFAEETRKALAEQGWKPEHLTRVRYGNLPSTAVLFARLASMQSPEDVKNYKAAVHGNPIGVENEKIAVAFLTEAWRQRLRRYSNLPRLRKIYNNDKEIDDCSYQEKMAAITLCGEERILRRTFKDIEELAKRIPTPVVSAR